MTTPITVTDQQHAEVNIDRKELHRLCSELPWEIQQIINRYIRRWQWQVCISKIHESPEWQLTYTHRKYHWLRVDGYSTDSVTATNRVKYDIADALRYQDFISGQGLLRNVVTMWKQYRIEPTVEDVIRLPYSINVLAYAYSMWMASMCTTSHHTEDFFYTTRHHGPDYYAKDMLAAVASDIVGSTQLMTDAAKRRILRSRNSRRVL